MHSTRSGSSGSDARLTELQATPLTTETEAADRRRTLASFVVAIAVAAVSIWTILDRGWVPFDEGTIALAAERVMYGALAHRDFADPYSGGLPYWHALAMRVFGVSLLAPRYGLFAAFLLWLPALWWLAVRTCGRGWAVVVVAAAAWWSLPVYPAAMPTWYLLFFATWILVALERWHSSRATRWLLLAGLLAGAAVTVKQTGLYLVAGLLLGVLFTDQERARGRWAGAAPAGRTDPLIPLLLALLFALVLKLLSIGIGSGELLHLILPIGAVLTLAALRESRLTSDRWQRYAGLMKAVGLVVAGIALPVALFLLPYLRAGAFGALFAEAVGGGIERITSLHLGMRPAGTLLLAVWPVFGVILLEAWPLRDRRMGRIAAFVLAAALLWLSIRSVGGYRRLWFFGTAVLPIGVTAAAWAGWRSWRANQPADPVLLALAGMTALHALNQFPFAAPNYYAYVAPLAILTAATAAAQLGVLKRGYATAFMVAVFAGTVLRIGSVHSVGGYPVWWDYDHRLAVPRGGLLVSRYDSVRYGGLLQLVEQHREQRAVLAGPELPELYFLSGSLPPGRDSYSMFAAEPKDSAQLAATFDTTAANMIVIKRRPMFAPALPNEVYQWLIVRYPVGQSMDTLEARWRR